MKKKTVFMVVGSSGGHIYPALAIADSLKKHNIEVEFISPGTPTDKKILAPYKTQFIFMGRLNRVSWRETLGTLLRLPLVILKAWHRVQRYKPNYVVGFGGALSGPVLLGAFLARTKTFLFEPNAYAGLANRWAGRFVDTAFVVMPTAARQFKTSVQVRMPVRTGLQPTMQNPIIQGPATMKGLQEANKLKVLVLGGSQGSKFMNTTVLQVVKSGASELENIIIRHQTGAQDFKRLQQAYQELQPTHPALKTGASATTETLLQTAASKIKVEAHEYLDPIAPHYEWADLIITRSGMGVLAELSVAAKPAILVPLASAADNHQQLNAQQAVEKQAARMILQKDFTAATLMAHLNELAQKPELLTAMAHNIKGLYSSPMAADELAQHLIGART